MDLLSGIGAATMFLRSAGDFVDALKNDGASAQAQRQADFRAVLNAMLETGSDTMGEMREARQATRLDAFAERAMQLYDADADGRLTRSELGLGPRVFERFDADADGWVTQDELRAALSPTSSGGSDTTGNA